MTLGRRRRRGWRDNRVKVLFLLPALVVFSLVVIVPIVWNGFYAFTDWTGFGSAFNWVGSKNFVRLISDAELHRAFLNTLVYTLINSPIQIALGLVLALALQGSGRVVSILRLFIVMPIAITGVVIGFIGS